jgi:hypothetical protein
MAQLQQLQSFAFAANENESVFGTKKKKKKPGVLDGLRLSTGEQQYKLA